MVVVKMDRRKIATFDGSTLIGWTASDEALAYVRELFSAYAKRRLVVRSWWD